MPVRNLVPMDVEGTIDEAECWHLLDRGRLGRLALSVDALPSILPAPYTVAGGEITVHLGELRVPDRCADGAVVAFSVDEIDIDRARGWYVHAVGRSQLEALATGPGAPERDQVVRLMPAVLGGRRFRLPTLAARS